MPEAVFRIVLPSFWLALGLGVGANRWLVRRRVGRDPIVVRPWQKADSPSRYLERALSISVVVSTADVVSNALWPAKVAEALGIGALRQSRAVGFAGLGLLALGSLLAALAVLQMGSSWRIGIDDRAPGPLVSRGIFARVRHPIYGGMLVAAAGFAAVTADLLSVAVAAAAAVGLPLQARLEESFLASRYPEAYPAYLAQTGRFWPRVRRIGDRARREESRS